MITDATSKASINERRIPNFEVTASIKKNLQIDWFKKPDARAQIMLAVRKSLTRKGVENELQDILTEIMERAEARYREWTA